MTNNTGVTTHDVAIAFSVPLSLTVVSISEGGAVGDDLVEWMLPEMADDDTVSLRVTVETPQTYATLFGLLYTTGLRCSEAFALNLGDVDLDRNLLSIRQGKFGKSRWVPISPSISKALLDYIRERSSVAPATAERPLFLTSTGRRVYHTNADFAFLAGCFLLRHATFSLRGM